MVLYLVSLSHFLKNWKHVGSFFWLVWETILFSRKKYDHSVTILKGGRGSEIKDTALTQDLWFYIYTENILYISTNVPVMESFYQWDQWSRVYVWVWLNLQHSKCMWFLFLYQIHKAIWLNRWLMCSNVWRNLSPPHPEQIFKQKFFLFSNANFILYIFSTVLCFRK